MAYTRLDSLHLGFEGACPTQEHHVEGTMKPELVCRCHGSVQQDLERYVHLRTGPRVRNLSGELRPNGVVLRGPADSY